MADRDEVKFCSTIPLIEIIDLETSEIIPINEDLIEHFKNYKEANQS